MHTDTPYSHTWPAWAQSPDLTGAGSYHKENKTNE